ncbi:MAG: tetratricopeptide repeat protein [Spirochaetales bacterium]|jgi:putative GTP pyrophosphokinase|nr:tetratricopeptide repeat protein [Spirochaetales bacterium]
MNRIALKDISRTILERLYAGVQPVYEKYLEDFAAGLLALMADSGIRFTLKRRLKTFDSLFEKVLRKAKELNSKPDRHAELERDNSVLITDLIGMRIICAFGEDAVRVEDLIRGRFEVVERERKGEDYSPREFGYEAVHLIIKLAGRTTIAGVTQEEVLCEVQLRTILQDAWAEVEHELLYKAEFTPFDEPIRRRLAAVNANLSLVDTIFQEIRDYQRRLQEELRKRRESVLQKIETEMPAAENTQPPPEEQAAAEAPSGAAYPEQTSIGKNLNPHFAVSLIETNDGLLLDALTAHNDRRYEEAIAIYSRLLSRRPKTSMKAIIYIHRGMAYFGSSRYQEALEDFTAAVSLDKKNVRAYYYRGVVYRFMQDHRRALNDFDRCAALDPYQFDAVFARSQVYFGLGDYIMAYEDCSRALAIRPDDKKANRFLEVVKGRMQF